jgi:hypothetical protein
MEENLGRTLASTEAEHPKPGTQPPARETATGSRQARSSKEGGNEAAGEGENPQYAKTQRRARSSPTARAVRTYCPPPSPQAPRRGLALVLPCAPFLPLQNRAGLLLCLPNFYGFAQTSKFEKITLVGFQNNDFHMFSYFQNLFSFCFLKKTPAFDVREKFGGD